ncbi:hypothetical protein F2Q68_00040723 [Brassica cretica]|uniref:RNase H type-1 domain-containing protein n=2 Tax=Brassica cretica TaxID=69181 RepID=A0ABQ7A4L5_BRACR|nr:hypothetical protein F2Q68_00040723 [Brassica cretica]KAF3492618.1 hypothetical protein DY000_02054826 [Brassica cretica]
MEDTVLNEALEDIPTVNQAPEAPKWRCQVDTSWISAREDTGLVNLIQRDDEEWRALAPELDEIKAMCSSFDIFFIAYVSWSLNIRADGLAKRVCSRDLRVPYVQSCAPWWLASVANQMDAA